MQPVDFETISGGDARLAAAADDLAVARSQVEAARLVGPDQELVRKQAIEFIEQHPDGLHRSCPTGHLTGSALVVDPHRARTLLIHHAKLDRWLQPGGHADGDGNLGAVSLREATEETGLVDLRLVVPAIDIDIHRVPARSGEPAHLHYDLRHLVLVGDCTRPDPNHEALDAEWVGGDAPIVQAGSELGRAVQRALDVARLVVGV